MSFSWKLNSSYTYKFLEKLNKRTFVKVKCISWFSLMVEIHLILTSYFLISAMEEAILCIWFYEREDLFSLLLSHNLNLSHVMEKDCFWKTDNFFTLNGINVWFFIKDILLPKRNSTSWHYDMIWCPCLKQLYFVLAHCLLHGRKWWMAEILVFGDALEHWKHAAWSMASEIMHWPGLLMLLGIFCCVKLSMQMPLACILSDSLLCSSHVH